MRSSWPFWVAAAFAVFDLVYRIGLGIETGKLDIPATLWWVTLVFASWYLILSIAGWLVRALISTLARVFSRSRVSSKDDRTGT